MTTLKWAIRFLRRDLDEGFARMRAALLDPRSRLAADDEAVRIYRGEPADAR